MVVGCGSWVCAVMEKAPISIDANAPNRIA
jgi:hypothetical protein